MANRNITRTQARVAATRNDAAVDRGFAAWSMGAAPVGMIAGPASGLLALGGATLLSIGFTGRGMELERRANSMNARGQAVNSLVTRGRGQAGSLAPYGGAIPRSAFPQVTPPVSPVMSSAHRFMGLGGFGSAVGHAVQAAGAYLSAKAALRDARSASPAAGPARAPAAPQGNGRSSYSTVRGQAVQGTDKQIAAWQARRTKSN